MKSMMIAGAAAFLLVGAGITATGDAHAAGKGPKKPASAITVVGIAQIVAQTQDCPQCGEGREVAVCFEGVLTGDLEGTFKSALFDPLLEDGAEVAVLSACSNISISPALKNPLLKNKKLITEEHVVATNNPDAPLGFDVVGELLTVVGRDCDGLITLLGDALKGAPYVGKLICPTP